MKGGAKVVVTPHRHAGVFIARGKEDALVTRNLVPGVSVYGEKRISVEVQLCFGCLGSVKWDPFYFYFLFFCLPDRGQGQNRIPRVEPVSLKNRRRYFGWVGEYFYCAQEQGIVLGGGIWHLGVSRVGLGRS